MSSITTEGCRAPARGWTVHRAALLLIFLALLLLWSPAAAKIIVEPGPAELPTDGINVDDERFVPVWQAYSPLEFLTIVLLIHCPLAVPFESSVQQRPRVPRLPDLTLSPGQQETVPDLRLHPGPSRDHAHRDRPCHRDQPRDDPLPPLPPPGGWSGQYPTLGRQGGLLSAWLRCNLKDHLLSPQEQYPPGDPRPAPRRPRHHAVRDSRRHWDLPLCGCLAPAEARCRRAHRV